MVSMPYKYKCTFFEGLRCHDRMVVGFTTTYAISAYHHQNCEFEPRSGEMYLFGISWKKILIFLKKQQQKNTHDILLK
jgi:hypothetical protein